MRLLGLVLLLTLETSIVHAAIYKCLDGQGGTHYQNAPCTGDDSPPAIRTEEQPASTDAQPRRSSPRRTPAAAAQNSLQSAREEAHQQARQDALRHVSIDEVQKEEGPSRFVLRGKVRNDGKQRVEGINLRVEWHDTAGNVVDVHFPKPGRLEPGQAKSWSVSTRRSARITQYQVSLLKD